MTSTLVKPNASAEPASVDLAQLETADPIEMLRFAHQHYGTAAAIGTSFQPTGLVILDLAFRNGIPLRVFTIDTLRLHPETYAHIDAVERHFNLQVERIQPNADDIARMERQHGEYLFFDSPEKRIFCCRMRKDRPNALFLRDLDCWVTGLRRDQSEERGATRRAQIIHKYGKPTLKLAPLADWDEARVLEYIAQHQLPTNPLHGAGYATIGCIICTTPVRPHESKRAGRWRWEQAGTSKECGLHLEDGAGI